MAHEVQRIKDPKTVAHLASNGITITVVNEDIFTWNVEMKGPKGTPYEGGVFKYTVRASEDYP
jgi:ubiquitin-protein ligase